MKASGRWALAAVFSVFLLGSAAQQARGADLLEEIVVTGSSANRIDLVITGDGYTAEEADLFRQHVQDLLAGLFGETPWSAYGGYFNLFQVVTQSAESGADHPSQGVYRDTYFNAQFDYYGIERLTWANVSKIVTVVTELVPEVDQIVLLINDPAYGGSGGTVAMVSAHPDAVMILVHELGHSFGNLADEYTDPYPGYTPGDPEPNVDLDCTFEDIKWNLWIEPGTPLPTLAQHVTGTYLPVGAYEGARYLATGIYRPAPNCLMRSLSYGYCDVCREAMVVGFYGYVDPLDAVSPEASEMVVDRGRVDLLPVVFLAEAVSPLSEEPLLARWSLEEQPSGQGSEFAFDPWALDLPNGLYQLEVEIRDPTPWVRGDPQEVLVSRHSWAITVQGEAADAGAPGRDALPSVSDGGGGDGGAGLHEPSPGGCGCHVPSGSAPGFLAPLLLWTLWWIGCRRSR